MKATGKISSLHERDGSIIASVMDMKSSSTGLSKEGHCVDIAFHAALYKELYIGQKVTIEISVTP